MAADDAIDHDAGPPLYRQLAAILRRKIRAGDYMPGRLLPSEGTLARDYGVSRQTVRKALALLRDEDGLVETAVGRGSYVADPLPPAR
jgi:GntR family transcriptional regulator